MKELKRQDTPKLTPRRLPPSPHKQRLLPLKLQDSPDMSKSLQQSQSTEKESSHQEVQGETKPETSENNNSEESDADDNYKSVEEEDAKSDADDGNAKSDGDNFQKYGQIDEPEGEEEAQD